LKKNQSNQQTLQMEIDKLTSKKRKELFTRERVRLLQLKLYQKAKRERSYKFYVLYDKISLGYVLAEAYKRTKANNGKPGIDGQRFADIEKYGREKYLAEIGEEMRKRTYRPKAVKRVWVEKSNGGKRPLGIPTIKDRVVQQSCKMVIEPIFEADFSETSYGFRPKRSAKEAIKEVRKNLRTGKHSVYEADLSKYFDTIPHDKLIIALKERIADPRVINLIKLWLKAPIVEEDGKYTGGKKSKKGTPQGGVISPLLANIYLNLLDRIVNSPKGYYRKRGITMIRYADDFILMSKYMNREAVKKVQRCIERMGLSINTEKSRLINAKESPFHFLGFAIRYDRSVLFEGKRFWNIKPKAESEKKIRQKINQKLKEIGHYSAEKVVTELNPIIRGWMNYYKIERVSNTQVAFRKLEDYLRNRLLRYYNRKSQRKTRLYGQKAFDKLVKEYGLIKPYMSSGIRPVNTI